ncbi:MAG: type II toxin-antitoxin system RelE/ParE family toxin [Candidatus Riflebacteria bacterium]|nr:type II toxin-antitoxin system RelE/ParE family toxin [Candidatus Riflebacteria bacterium]
MNFVFHPSAREELNKAVDYYDNCEIGLGYDFLEEVYAAIKRIQAYPEAWSPFSSRTRSCLTHRFPYSVVYLIKNNEIMIIAVAHSHQKPDYWQKRLTKDEPKNNRKKSR